MPGQEAFELIRRFLGHGCDSSFLLLADTKSQFSKNHGWDAGIGDGNGRWAMAIDKDGTVEYAENEKDPAKVTVSGAEEVLKVL